MEGAETVPAHRAAAGGGLIVFVLPAPDSEASSRAYAEDVSARGYVMNLTRLWAWRPDVYDGFQELRTRLTKPSTLSPRELGVLVCGMAGGLGDSYCALAWGKKLADATDEATAAAVLAGKGTSGLSKREAALAAWARRVAVDPNATTAADVEALRAAGLGEREIVEATLFIAFRIAFSTVNDALGARPDWQLAAAAPQGVREAVSFGRKISEPSPASA
jgi:alkylhydroperoxidase family enzyme